MSTLIREPLYLKLMERLRRNIERDRPRLLPSENDLIREYGVSRNTVRRAIQELTAEGLLRPVQGLGTLVYPVPAVRDNSTILILVDRDWQLFERDAFDRLLLRLDECKLHALVMMVSMQTPDLDRIELLLKRADGIIVNWRVTQSRPIVELIGKHRKKTVCLRGRMAEPEFLNYVVDDLEYGTCRMASHLLELGHRKIACLVDLKDAFRMAGLERAFREAGVPMREELCMQVKGPRAGGFRAAAELLRRKRPFSAIIAQNDITALGIMEHLLIAGIRIPEQVSLVGFDDLAESREYPVPLTTCGHILDQLVNRALEFLLNNDSFSCHLVLKPEIVVRASTAPPPGELYCGV